MRVTFLLGAGVSKPSGLPDVASLGERVLGDYTPRRRERKGRVEVRRFRDFLRHLADLQYAHVRDVGLGDGQTNYEHLFHLCRVVERTVSRKVHLHPEPFATVAPFVRALEETVAIGPDLQSIYEHEEDFSASNPFLGVGEFVPATPLEWLARRSAQEIQLAVQRALSEPVPEIKGFGPIRSAVCDSEVERLDIITLNHDDLIERTLWGEGVEFWDGFGAPDGEVRWMEWESLQREGSRSGRGIRVIKPHGSLDWLHMESDRRAGPAKTVGDGHGVPRDGDGRPVLVNRRDPLFLTGGRKELDYENAVYALMRRASDDALESTRTVVTSGFSFNDVAWAHRLITWCEVVEGRRIVLLHRNPEEIRNGSLGLVPRRFDDLVDRKLLTVEKQWFGEVRWEDLRSLIATD